MKARSKQYYVLWLSTLPSTLPVARTNAALNVGYRTSSHGVSITAGEESRERERTRAHIREV